MTDDPAGRLREIQERLAGGERLTPGLRASLLAAVYAVDPAATEDVLAPLSGVSRVHLYESLVGWAALAPGERVLDLGTGSGGAARAAAAAVGPKGLVIGIDQSEEAVEVARSRTPDDLGVVYRVGRAESLAAIPDRSVDCVVASLLLEDLPSLGPVLDEIARVLRPGGRLVASVTAFDRLRPLDAPILGAAIAVLAQRVPGVLTGRATMASIPHDPADAAAFRAAGLHTPEERDVYLSTSLETPEHAWALFGRTQMAYMLDDAGREALRAALAREVPCVIHLPVRFLRTRRPG